MTSKGWARRRRYWGGCFFDRDTFPSSYSRPFHSHYQNCHYRFISHRFVSRIGAFSGSIRLYGRWFHYERVGASSKSSGTTKNTVAAHVAGECRGSHCDVVAGAYLYHPDPFRAVLDTFCHSILSLAKGYRISEVKIREGDWLAERMLKNCRLKEEGINVLGVHRKRGAYVGSTVGETVIHVGDRIVAYGRIDAIKALEARRKGIHGEIAHNEAVAEQRKTVESEKQK